MPKRIKLTPADEYTPLFVQDVNANPTHYNKYVVNDPEAQARRVIDGLSDDEIKRFIRELKQEMRLLAKHS